MKKVYCKNTKRGRHEFYINIDGTDYYLFSRTFRVSNDEYYSKGVSFEDSINHSKSKSFTVLHIMDELPKVFRYIEKEYNVIIFDKTFKKKNMFKKEKCA